MTGTRRGSGVRQRRIAGVVAVVVLAVVAGVATAVAALVTDGKRVESLWVGAAVAADGSVQVVEVVDYDFGAAHEHGIYRWVPGLRTSAPVQVSSPDAPADVSVAVGATPRIRVGDPDRTVTGRHRYVLRYTLDGVAPAGRLAWDAVGTGWDAAIAHAEVHAVAPAALQGIRCQAGNTGSTASCEAAQPEPGALVARADGLGAGQGVTVSATEGTRLVSAPALPAPPAASPPARGGAAPVTVGVLAGVPALLVGLLVCRVLRRAGRERLPEVGVPTAPGEDAGIDLADLEAQATPSPTLPAGLTPAQGGVLLADGVEDAHKAAAPGDRRQAVPGQPVSVAVGPVQVQGGPSMRQ